MVDFPAPVGPTMPSEWPASRSNETPSSPGVRTLSVVGDGAFVTEGGAAADARGASTGYAKRTSRNVTRRPSAEPWRKLGCAMASGASVTSGGSARSCERFFRSTTAMMSVLYTEPRKLSGVKRLTMYTLTDTNAPTEALPSRTAAAMSASEPPRQPHKMTCCAMLSSESDAWTRTDDDWYEAMAPRNRASSYASAVACLTASKLTRLSVR
mmetsp:Transcript_25642/g.102237  ORF Transcript_25642/g.102237 Transcript_25642/m.102237 type:complete len:211 (-) Transcript_25642:1202-1834(-)